LPTKFWKNTPNQIKSMVVIMLYARKSLR
jgi:hypothetical protein